MYHKAFWSQLMQFVCAHEIIIDRPRGSAHPRYPDFIYPIDYGFLKGTKSSADGNEIDIWVGSLQKKVINGILCSIDCLKKDLETKIIYACTDEEIHLICNTMNTRMSTLYIANKI